MIDSIILLTLLHSENSKLGISDFLNKIRLFIYTVLARKAPIVGITSPILGNLVAVERFTSEQHM